MGVSIPEDSRRGQFRINGQLFDFRVEVKMMSPAEPQGWFWFRPATKKHTAWDKRPILSVHDGAPGLR